MATMDPGLLDLIYDIREALESHGTYQVISAHRINECNLTRNAIESLKFEDHPVRVRLFCSAAKPSSPVPKQFLEKHFNANYPPGLVATDMTDRPQFANIPEHQWVPTEKSGELVVALASGIADKIAGRFIHVPDDLNMLIEPADEIIEHDLGSLNMQMFNDSL